MKFPDGHIKLKYVIIRSQTIHDYYFVRIIDEAQIHADQVSWFWDEKEKRRKSTYEIVGAGFLEALTDIENAIEDKIDVACYGISTSCNVSSRYAQDLRLIDQERLHAALKAYYESDEHRFHLNFYAVLDAEIDKVSFFSLDKRGNPFHPFTVVDELNSKATEQRDVVFTSPDEEEVESYTQGQIVKILEGNIYCKEVALDVSRKKNKKSTYRSFYVPVRHYLLAQRLEDEQWVKINPIIVDNDQIKQARLKLVKTGVY